MVQLKVLCLNLKQLSGHALPDPSKFPCTLFYSFWQDKQAREKQMVDKFYDFIIRKLQ